MDTADFANAVGGELSAGNVLAVVNGKKQYLYRSGELTEVGRPLWLAWQDSLSAVPNAPVAKRRGRPPKESFHGMG